MSPRPESMPIPEDWSEERKDIHRLIQEFRDHLAAKKYEAPTETGGVVVLSAPQELRDNEVVEKTDENVARIEYSIDLVKQITAKKAGKPLEEVTSQDIIAFGPPLILNGETEQLPMMQEVARESGFPEEKVQLLNSGDRGKSNTKTQFERINDDPRYQNTKHFIFVSTSYHIPRVTRTADKNLDQNVNFEVIGVPLDTFDYNVYRKVRGEVKRILSYSERGDVSRFLKEPAFPLVEFGKHLDDIKLHHVDEVTPLPDNVQSLRDQLDAEITRRREQGESVPFSGELANVEDFQVENGKITLHTAKTDYFSFLASSYIFRENHKENPIKPLAVSATLVGPDGTILFEKRTNVTEMEGKFHIFGGSLKPGQEPKSSMKNILQRKLGLEVDDQSIEISGADLENLQNIVEIFFVVNLTEDQVRSFQERFGDASSKERKDIHEISSKKDLKKIEEMFHEKDITDWNPSGFYNVMYALIKIGTRTPEEVEKIVKPLQKKISRKPYRYDYPIKNYLPDLK
ncbi:MAG TPA: hypothetical protein VJC11_02585 [Patescibacteria group bacterium]|nr:hypothetical protein [Patescibacteria group bacterium]